MGLQIVGKENLPPADTPAVYVSNHQSFLVSLFADCSPIMTLQVPFELISAEFVG